MPWCRIQFAYSTQQNFIIDTTQRELAKISCKLCKTHTLNYKHDAIARRLNLPQKSPSSEPSTQSFSELHFSRICIHNVLLHWNSCGLHCLFAEMWRMWDISYIAMLHWNSRGVCTNLHNERHWSYTTYWIMMEWRNVILIGVVMIIKFINPRRHRTMWASKTW